MFHQKGNEERKEEGNTKLVAVAIDRDKGSQYALKWAVDNLLSRGQTVILVHVSQKSSGGGPNGSRLSDNVAASYRQQIDSQTRELFLPHRCFCTRKDIQCKDVVLEDSDVSKALTEYVSHAVIENLVVGCSRQNPLMLRFKTSDIPANVSRAAPDFCTVYVVTKGKVSSMRSACRPAPAISPLRAQLMSQNSVKSEPVAETVRQHNNSTIRAQPPEPAPAPAPAPRYFNDDTDSIKSPFSRAGWSGKSYGDISSDSDISFVSSGRPSTDRMYASLYETMDRNPPWTPARSMYSDQDNRSFESRFSGPKSTEYPTSIDNMSFNSQDSGGSGAGSWSSSQNMDDVEAEMRRLRLELKQTMDMYSTACKEALTAKQKAMELHRWKMEEEHRLEEARISEEAALSLAEKEKAKCKAALEAAEAAQRIAELEAQKRISAEMHALKETEEKKKVLDALAQSDIRYRKYSIEEIEEATEKFNQDRKIGEGGYGPVYKGFLDHTQVAIKVLRPDATQGRSQFQQEIEVLSCIRHPNMVLLLGACPEYGCLVYEYMGNGSLDDRLFCRGNSPVLSWQLRFKIAAEIGTGLLFLHGTKPEPLVHRDLKPGNILLDNNYVSKISDVGLARLVPASIANTVTQYRMTSAAGTFCYIDPEYQQTGMLGIKSDIYSLGIMLLQIITSKNPMGLAHHVERSIEKGTFKEMLDPAVPDWPVAEAMEFAQLALKCAELRRKDRPDLGKEILPKLNQLKALAEQSMPHLSSDGQSNRNNGGISQDVISESNYNLSGYDSSRSPSGGASMEERRASRT